MNYSMNAFFGTIDRQGVAAVEAAVRDLVSIRDVGDRRFVSLPMLYPDGSNVTLSLSHGPNGIRVSDNGFAYRDAESVGAERSFERVARGIAEPLGVDTSSRLVYVDAALDDLYRAICDVAAVSWKVANEISARTSESQEIEMAEEIRVRLRRVFGEAKVSGDRKVLGASTREWEVSAIVRGDHGPVIFQVVSKYENSVFRAVTAFGDIANVERPPALVAVIANRAEMGNKLALLSREARVIEISQSDNVFLKAVA